MLSVTSVTDQTQWNTLVDRWGGHPMQAWQWGEFKAATGAWSAHRIQVSRDADNQVIGGGQLLIRTLPFPFRAIGYAPRGIMAQDLADFPAVADACANWCKENFHAVSLKIDPPLEELRLPVAWKQGSRVMLERTAIIDLQPSEEDIMKGLHSRNARNYIRKGGRVGIEVEAATAEDIPAVLDLYHQTAERDRFSLHPDSYYEQAYTLLGDLGQLTVTRFEGEVLSFMWNITNRWGACELWAGAGEKGRKMRANYPLKWGAILAAKRVGAERYDMNGLLNDGISEFKRSFQHEETRFVGAWDRPNSPLYYVWEKALATYKKLR